MAVAVVVNHMFVSSNGLKQYWCYKLYIISGNKVFPDNQQGIWWRFFCGIKSISVVYFGI